MSTKVAPAERSTSAMGLAKLPEEAGYHYVFVDLSESYDEKLLTRFYKDLMIPNFPIQDELDPLEKWVELLSPFGAAAREPSSAESPPDFHVLLLLKQQDGARNYDDGSIMGGVVFEYYVSSNTGLLTYLLVSTKYRSLGLGRLLTDRCRELLEQNAKSRGHLAGCNAIFLETNSASKVQESEDVMSPAKRHQIFFKMGLRLVDFDYVQAPLFRGKKKVNFLLLCVFLTARIPKLEDKSHDESYYLPSALLKNTIRAFWSHSSRITQYRYQDDVDFKRMMDQLSRREKISLLDLPWERPFTIVDLRNYFDLELLVSFYQDMLSPCFKGRQDELDSLDTWITMLTPSQKRGTQKNEAVRDDTTESLHVLLALKYSEDEEENAKPMIAGGLAFEYYPSNNCGLLTYLITPVGERGGRMARALIEQALEVLDLDARFRGQLGGCNVVFMETADQSLAPSQQQQQELIDMTQQYATLEKMGWKMLDFEYIQPPFIDTAKKRAMNLMVFMTPRIPKLSQEESEYLFLPRSTVKNFIKDVWEVNCNRMQYDFHRDTLYKRMMMQLERREKIPLLNRSEGKPWTLVDLIEDYDLELLKRFYKELIEPNKDAKDADVSMETWLAKFAPENMQKKTSGEDHHALVALRSGQTEGPVLLGGLTFKYFTLTNCGLMIRTLVKNVEKREEVTKALVDRAVDVLDQNAVSRGHLVGCNAIFLEIRETQVQKTGEGAEFDMDISRQHLLLERMGWRLLDFNYVAPPSDRSREPSRSLSLTVFLTNRIPRVPYAQEGYEYHYLPKLTVRNFMEHYWRESSRPSIVFEQDPEYVKMMDLIDRRERIPLLELPWQRPWTLVDLWEDFDVELLYKFYNNFLVVAHPDKADREPLSDWLKYLSPSVRDNPEVEDFHILLALNYPRQQTTTAGMPMKPNILGGLVFKFSSTTNCGLLTFLSVAPQYGVVMAKALVEEATEILVENAISRGHIAGCNAIFMEVPGSARAAADEKNVTFIDHDVLYGMGWKMLNFLYVHPPQSIHGQGKQCLLLALNTANIPKEQGEKGVVAYIPKDLVQSFVRSRWTSAYSRIGKLLSRDRLYKHTLAGLERLDRVVLCDPPWTLPPLPLPAEPVSANESAARTAAKL